MTPAEARSRFRVLERCAYLNAGSVGPLAQGTVEAMRGEEERALAEGRASPRAQDAAIALWTRLCERLAALVRVPMENMLLTTSTTEGCNLVVTGLRLEPEHEVVTTDAEHPGLLQPLLASGARIRQARVLERPPSEALNAVLAEVTPRTRLVALSHVLWLNGHVLPLAEIKRATGLPLLVDGAQSVGAVPVDASVADWYTVSGQKWLCGPELTGALYVAEPDRLRPQIQSYAATVLTGAGRLALVHLPASLAAGLLAAVEELPGWGFRRAAELVRRCRQTLLELGAEVRTEPEQATLVSFRVPGDPAALVKQAEGKGVIIRSLPDGWLRASVGWWNDEQDLDRLAEVVAEARSPSG